MTRASFYEYGIMTTTRGKFIVIDGGEGSGKGTISDHLKTLYEGKGVVFTREPGGTPLAEELRAILKTKPMRTMTELLLFNAARAEHLEDRVGPALMRGEHVICDRFESSTFAYQVHARWQGKHEDLFWLLSKEVVATPPDLYIFCDVHPEVALKRRHAAGEVDRFDSEAMDFHERVYRGFKDYFAMLPSSRVITLDTSRPTAEVLEEVTLLMRRELGF